jgi:hypothetical protein
MCTSHRGAFTCGWKFPDWLWLPSALSSFLIFFTLKQQKYQSLTQLNLKINIGQLPDAI